jgi:tRNA A37 threonylcarbamoyladenosine biosynthesis protein TsaE
MVLTGEVGTGKTTLLPTLLQELDGNVEVAFTSGYLHSFTSSARDLLSELLQMLRTILPAGL